jgi:hypothetical protein
MTFKHLYLGAFSAVALSALSGTVQAAPLYGSASALKSGTVPSTIEKAAYRRCWWRHGYRVCRWVGYSDYDYYDDGPYYYSYGPSVGFRFGGGGRFHGGHGRHR